jgi:adenosylhomocysteine nucleosidase
MIVVVGLAFEARIAAGPGMRVICSGDGRNLVSSLAKAIREARLRKKDCGGLISFGVAGGLDPDLLPGTCVVGSAVLNGDSRTPTGRGLVAETAANDSWRCAWSHHGSFRSRGAARGQARPL